MGEYPPLSDEEIMAINVQKFVLESGACMDSVTVTAEFLGHRDE